MDVAELQQLLQAADPAAFLVPYRILRRVIRQGRRRGGIQLQVPHRKSTVIKRDELLRIADREELGISADQELAPVLFLIVRPEPHRLAAWPREQILVRYWQALFHCRVHLAFARRFPPGDAGDAEIRRRIHQLGQAEFAEIRRVLCQEKYLSSLSEDREVYEEFVALYLELRFFAANLLPHLFPDIDDFDRVDALLAEDVDGRELFAQTRLRGAPDPVLISVGGALESAQEPDQGPPVAAPCSEEKYRQLLARAAGARERGNLVRAAILDKEAEEVCPAGVARPEPAPADLEELVRRLQPALDLDPAEADEWRQILPALLTRAARGLWPVEARLLYDLQRVCLDHERGIFALHGLSWLLSLGRRPLKQPLPNQREAQMLKHLRKAARRAVRTRLPDLSRQRLVALLEAAVHRREEQLRERLEPVLRGVFDRVGLNPQNYPERVALHKLLEELLDCLLERGFLNLGDLRDAVSRNNLKLADLSGPRELVRGDPLLRLDRELAGTLDGMYRPGEIYLRGLQRFSAVAFGTPAGRFLTRFVALPLGGAFVALKGVEEIVHIAHHLATGEKHGPHIATPLAVGLLGVFLFGLLNVPPFRQAVGTGLNWLARGLRLLFLDLPAFVVRLPLLQAVLGSRPVTYLARHLLGPLILTGLVLPVFLLADCALETTLAGCGAVLLGSLLFFNSRAGRNVQETLLDWGLRGWHRLHADLLPGLFRLVLDFFKKLLEQIERLLYTVDEWLRFKGGEGRLSLAIKAVLGPLWFVLTYVLRIYINLLIEPTFNPIKHFPVVTVSAKIMAPMSLTIYHLLETPLLPLGKWIAAPFAGLTLLFLPGFFGFLVWELKENWKLYRASRAPTLRPVVIGHHGETLLRLMRPGLHSGTLPKLFARLRRAERHAQKTRHWKTARHQLEALHHVEERLRHFVERELVYLLAGSRGWGLPLHLGEIALGSNRIRVELVGPGAGRENLEIVFEEHAGWLLAGVSRPGWLGVLSAQQTLTLKNALAGFYKLAGVSLVREQVEACFGPTLAAFEVEKNALAVWPAGAPEEPVRYPLGEEEVLRPCSRLSPGQLPELAPCQLLYSRIPLFWANWVAAWEEDQVGKTRPLPGMEEVRLLPGLPLTNHFSPEK